MDSERDQNNRATYRENWWVFGEPRGELRPALVGLTRYIATVETAKHRVFTFLPAEVMPDNKLIVIATDDAFHLGVVQSRQHVAWMLAQGNWLGVGNDPVYAKTQAFDPFPFPDATQALRARVASIAEEPDAHRKNRMSAHPHLTLTRLYNVLAAIRAGSPLTPQDRDIHDAGQVSILRDLHDRLDAAVADAYGWARDMDDVDAVGSVVVLNKERIAEEANGKVRWLRPAFQAPAESARTAQQTTLITDDIIIPGGAEQRWPKEEPAQFVALRSALRTGPLAPADIARRFKGAPRGDRLPKMLQTLVALGQARAIEGGRFTA